MISLTRRFRIWQAGILLMLGVIFQVVGWGMRLQTPNEFYSTQEPVANIESSLPSSNPSTTTVEEARIRAKILHETFHGVLQVVHRDFFREDQKLVLPSKSLEDVFSDLAKTHQIELRWLAVNTNAMRSNTSQRATLSK